MTYGQDRRRTPKNTTLIMDWIHIVIGVLIVLMAMIAFLNPEENQLLFPLIFLLAAILNLLNGVYRFRQSGHEKKKKALGIGQLVIALFLFLMVIISTVSIWG
ncbi:MAG: DUF6637 family protein [Hungatella sp.]